MLELKQQQISHKETKFIKLYEKWKDQVKIACTNLRNECSDKELSNMMDDVEGLEKQVTEAYEDVQSHLPPSTKIRRKMDSCVAATGDLMGPMKVRMSEVGLKDFDSKAENARLYLILDIQYLDLQRPNLFVVTIQTILHSQQKSKA